MWPEDTPWSLKRRSGQWLLEYINDGETSVVLFGRGFLTEVAEGDPEKLGASFFETGKFPPLAAPRQEHGRNVITVDEKSCLPERPEGDALFLDRPGYFGSLRFADCFPIVLCGRNPRRWVSVGHSGFVGSGMNVASAMVSTVSGNLGPDALDGALAWVGPGICGKCYGRKADDPWTMWGMKVFPSEYVILKEKEVHFDLSGIITRQLVESGVCESSVFEVPFCTLCRKDIFYSYRGKDEYSNFLLARLLIPGHNSRYWWENDNSDNNENANLSNSSSGV